MLLKICSRSQEWTNRNEDGHVGGGGCHDIGIGLLIVVQLIQSATGSAFIEINDADEIVRKVISH